MLLFFRLIQLIVFNGILRVEIGTFVLDDVWRVLIENNGVWKNNGVWV